MANYNRNVRPVRNNSDLVTVKLGLKLVQIADVVRTKRMSLIRGSRGTRRVEFLRGNELIDLGRKESNHANTCLRAPCESLLLPFASHKTIGLGMARFQFHLVTGRIRRHRVHSNSERFNLET